MLELLLRPGAGIIRASQLRAHGLEWHRQERLVQQGTLIRLRRGVFAAPGTSDDLITAATHGGALTCAKALRHHGIWSLASEAVPHVWVGHSYRPYSHPGCQCFSHFFRGQMQLGVASLEQSLVHVFHCHGEETFFAALESALHMRRLQAAGRARIRQLLPARARWLVDFARTDAESGLESLVRLRLHLIGIHVTPQVVISGVGRVDFVIDGRLIIEADGEENHVPHERRFRDLTRDAEASRQGYETLRFSYGQIVHRWASVEAAILAALARTRG